MLIGEVSRRTGLSKDTIRWYDRVGLINQGKTNRTKGNYRDFDDETLNLLTLIKQIKSLGFTINEIKEILNLESAGEFECRSLEESIKMKVNLINAKVHALEEIKSRLQFIDDNCNGNCKETIAKVS